MKAKMNKTIIISHICIPSIVPRLNTLQGFTYLSVCSFQEGVQAIQRCWSFVFEAGQQSALYRSVLMSSLFQ